MKRWITLACLAVAGATFIVAWWAGDSTANPGSAPSAVSTSRSDVLAVEELVRNADRHRGPLCVEGVVSVVSPEQRTLALIDTREYQACGVTDCAPLYLPVRWNGSMPSVEDLVQLEGEVREGDGKLVFVARTLRKVESQPENP